MSAPSERQSVIRVALSILERDGWVTVDGKNAIGFVLARDREILLVAGHGRWNLDQDDRDALYGRLLRFRSKHPIASRCLLVLPTALSRW